MLPLPEPAALVRVTDGLQLDTGRQGVRLGYQINSQEIMPSQIQIRLIYSHCLLSELLLGFLSKLHFL